MIDETTSAAGARERAAQPLPAVAQLRILLVEDEPDLADSIEFCLRNAGHEVRWERFGQPALERMAAEPFDILISDVRLPDLDGITLFEWTRENAPRTAVILMSAYGSIAEAVNALQHRALHYLHKPFAMDDLLDTLANFVRERDATSFALEQQRTPATPTERLVGRSPAMAALRRRVASLAHSDVPVLIQGETGTGKEVVARAIHDCSVRSKEPFIAVNCGAIPENLFESELFGHERGAFTGAVRKHIGKFVEAGQGTLFLDEISELPLHCQVKLLRVLQEGVVQPVGAAGTVTARARILAATNHPLRERVRAGLFREDLYFRLKVLDVRVPPLRERQKDIPLLVEYFLRRRGRSCETLGLTPFAWTLLCEYPFPGNVRELEHAIERAVVMSEGQTIDACHLPEEIRGLQPSQETHQEQGALSDAAAVFEARYIKTVLDHFGWSRKQAAHYLGISRKNLWEKIKKHGLQDPTKS